MALKNVAAPSIPSQASMYRLLFGLLVVFAPNSKPQHSLKGVRAAKRLGHNIMNALCMCVQRYIFGYIENYGLRRVFVTI